jgi:YHS domain-containing protein
MVTDPVCEMKIDENKAVGSSVYNGQTYYFCSQSCKQKFDQEPGKYAGQ